MSGESVWNHVLLSFGQVQWEGYHAGGWTDLPVILRQSNLHMFQAPRCGIKPRDLGTRSSIIWYAHGSVPKGKRQQLLKTFWTVLCSHILKCHEERPVLPACQIWCSNRSDIFNTTSQNIWNNDYFPTIFKQIYSAYPLHKGIPSTSAFPLTIGNRIVANPGLRPANCGLSIGLCLAGQGIRDGCSWNQKTNDSLSLSLSFSLSLSIYIYV